MNAVINEKLGAWLLPKEHTRTELAKRIGITLPTLNSRLMDGGWSWAEVLAICKLTGATPNELAGI